MWRFGLIVCLYALGSLFAWAGGEALPSAGYPEEFLQTKTHEDGSMTMSTPLAVYEGAEGKMVYLVGAVHIAEKGYYEELTRRFGTYDVLLFEMVGGENLQKLLELEKKEKGGRITEEEKKELDELKAGWIKKKDRENVLMKMLVGQYAKLASLMGVTTQKDGIDYSDSRFVHADMTEEEMAQAQKANGESFAGVILAGVVKSLTTPRPSSSPDLMEMIEAVRKEDKDALKRFLIGMMESEQKGSFLENSVLLEGRNDKCLRVFDKLVEERPDLKKVGIFYGAAHLNDLHRKLEKRGYKFRSVEWISAWKAAAKASPSED